MNATAITHSFEAMSTEVTILGVGVSRRQFSVAFQAIRCDTAAWEQRFSRFRSSSMLTRVNNAAGEWTAVDQVFLDLLVSSRRAVVATEGRFNPAILDALEAYGYDQTIARVQATSHHPPRQRQRVSSPDDWSNVEIDEGSMRVRMPFGMRIDFGGIAKGALADRLADTYATWPGGAISVGGDMRVWGRPPDGDKWRIGIENPLNIDSDLCVLDVPLGSGAIATSSRTKRTWNNDAGPTHHLIDPFTRAPTQGSPLAITAVANTAMEAEIVTKNLMVAACYTSLRPELLLEAHSALVISEDLHLTEIVREAA